MFHYTESNTGTPNLEQLALDNLTSQIISSPRQLQAQWDQLEAKERMTFTVLAKKLFPSDLSGQEKVITALIASHYTLGEGLLEQETEWLDRLSRMLLVK